MKQSDSSLLITTASMVALWAVCCWPAWNGGGQERLIWMSVAAAAGLVSAWLIWGVTKLTPTVAPEIQMFVQMSIRVVIVMGCVLVVNQLKPNFGFVDFYGWLFGFYLLGLVFEVATLRRTSVKKEITSADTQQQ